MTSGSWWFLFKALVPGDVEFGGSVDLEGSGGLLDEQGPLFQWDYWSTALRWCLVCCALTKHGLFSLPLSVAAAPWWMEDYNNRPKWGGYSGLRSDIICFEYCHLGCKAGLRSSLVVPDSFESCSCYSFLIR